MAFYYDFKPYVPVAKRRRQAQQRVSKLRKSGRELRPVEIEGRMIAATFWGQAWCTNLERYSDYENRLPRGRTYARNGSVIDLQVEPGRVGALVIGSDCYQIDISIAPLSPKRWGAIKSECAGKIDSVVELLQGSLSKGVMEIVTRKGEGLFPAPKEIALSCSCPDWADMCKHVAAALYGVGARLDSEPAALFTLRGVDPVEMVSAVIADTPAKTRRGKGRVLVSDDMSSLFGIELDAEAPPDRGRQAAPAKREKPAAKKKPAAKRKKPAAKRKQPAAKSAPSAKRAVRGAPGKSRAKKRRMA
jgi:uncharacterized Zn finger protein